MEKINVTKRKSGGREVTIQALRLRDPDELREAAAEGSDAETWQQALQEVERDDEDDGSYPVAMRTIERQVLDLLMNAGSRGVTNYVSLLSSRLWRTADSLTTEAGTGNLRRARQLLLALCRFHPAEAWALHPSPSTRRLHDPLSP